MGPIDGSFIQRLSVVTGDWIDNNWNPLKDNMCQVLLYHFPQVLAIFYIKVHIMVIPILFFPLQNIICLTPICISFFFPLQTVTVNYIEEKISPNTCYKLQNKEKPSVGIRALCPIQNTVKKEKPQMQRPLSITGFAKTSAIPFAGWLTQQNTTCIEEDNALLRWN